MKEITAYETSDGMLFTDARKAKDHQDDIIGEALDDLIPIDTAGHITRADRHKMLISMLGDKDLKRKIAVLYAALTFEDEED